VKHEFSSPSLFSNRSAPKKQTKRERLLRQVLFLLLLETIAEHFLACRHPSQHQMLDSLAIDLEKLQNTFKGDPMLHDLIKSAAMQSALDPNCAPNPSVVHQSLHHLLQEQTAAGWKHVLHGRITKATMQHQEDHCRQQHPQTTRTGKQWGKQPIHLLWKTVHKMWKN